MSYTLDVNPYNEIIVFDKPILHYVTHHCILRVSESSNTDLCGRFPKRDEAGVGHHGVSLGQVWVVLVDHCEGDAPVERPLQAVVVFSLHEVDVEREAVRVLRGYV